MAAGTFAEKSGVHLTGVDTGWPVATSSDTAEPEPKKAGDGTEPATKAVSVAGGIITDNAP